MKKSAISLCLAWAYLCAFGQNINQYEYWFDGDFGGRVATNVAASQTFILNTGIGTADLDEGLHVFHLRFRDDNLAYSPVVSQFFQKINANLTGNANLTAYEYWFDNDFANRVSQGISPQSTYTLNTGISTATLNEGLHVFHVRFRDVGGNWSHTVSQFFQKINENLTGNDQINGFEYWFDNDFANRVSQSVTPQSVYALNSGVATSALDEGLHVFHVRFRDVGGNWSLTVSQFFQKINQNLTGNDQIVGYEYWFDTDFAARVQEAVPPQPLFQLNTGISTSQLDKGLHVVHVRFQNAGGQWSHTVSQFFQKLGEGVGPTNNIAAYRYWFDDATGDAIEVPTNTAANPYYLIGNLNLSQLSEGQHTLNIQFRDELGQWSEVVIGTFNKLGSPRIDEISPSVGGNTGDVTVSITGTFFQPVKVRLERQGEQPILAPDSTVSVINGKLIKATFDLRNMAIGDWDVVVEIIGDTTMVKENGFAIEEGRFMEAWTELIGFPVIRANTWQTYSLKVGNAGNINLYGVPVLIGVPAGYDVDFLFEPTIIGDTLSQYDTLKNYLLLDSMDGNFIGEIRLYSFLVGSIPAGSVIDLNFLVKTASIGQTKIWYWSTTPLYGSPLKPGAAACIDDLISLGLGLALGDLGNCMYGLLRSQLDPIVAGAVEAQDNPNAPFAEVAGPILGDYFWGNYKTIVGCIAGPAFAAGLINPALYLAYNLISAGDEIREAVISCSPFYPPGVQKFLGLQTVNSFDPNEKLGPNGGGTMQYYGDEFPYNYAIHFENVDSATANAQSVLVLDTLDSDVFDYSTFQLGHLNIGDTIINIPAGRKQFQTLHNEIADQNVMVRITANFNDTTGVASWLFESLDPQTLELVANPFEGFLPPNQTAPEGEGAVHYSIKVKPSLPIDTEVKNSGWIYFDFNPPIITNTWLNTIDNIKPHSEVSNLAAVQSDTVFTVNWTGIDTSSGIKYYDVYVAKNSSDYRLWLSNVSYTSAQYMGQMDSTYSFYSVATDLAGNQEEKPTSPDAMTTIMLTDVSEVDLASGKISVYPNPASERLVVDGRNFRSSEVQVSLKDVFGRTLHTERIRAANGAFSTKINVSELPSGFYLLTTTTGGLSAVVKVSKQ